MGQIWDRDENSSNIWCTIQQFFLLPAGMQRCLMSLNICLYVFAYKSFNSNETHS